MANMKIYVRLLYAMNAIALQKNLYLILVKNEHVVAILCGILAISTPILGILPLFVLSVILIPLYFFGVHPASVGLSNGYFGSLPVIFVRSFTLSLLITYLCVSYPLHPFLPIDVFTIVVLELLWRGYFVEFMLRKNFSLWIALLFPCILSLIPYSVFFGYSIFDMGIVLSLIVVSSVIRIATKNVIDGLVWFLIGLLVRYIYIVQ